MVGDVVASLAFALACEKREQYKEEY